jgi:two-component system, chemotaxis family, sensor kinase Cph1
VINEELLAERSNLEQNIRLTGADYYLEPPTALSFSLVLHELVTNALKYGSLSVPGGTLDLSWDVIEQNAAKWLTV